jgi:uncharacterized membrane protein (DUF106 family)
MTPGDINTILVELGRIATKLDLQQEALTEIRKEVKRTNGRVSELEGREQVDRARLDEREHIAKHRREIRSEWLRPVIVGILVLAIGAAAVALLNIDKL